MANPLRPTVPRLLCVIDHETCQARAVDPLTAAALCANAGAAILARAKSLQGDSRESFFRKLVRIAHDADVVCILSSDPDTAQRFGADGAHLASSSPQLVNRPTGLLVGRSCHSLEDVAAAADEGVDYAFLSPIYTSSSKPGLEGRGLEFLKAATCAAKLPVIALGGVLPDRVAELGLAGAYGIAALGPFASPAAAEQAERFVREVQTNSWA